MENVKFYSDDVLLSETKITVEKERQVTAQLVEYLAEIESRMLFATLGFSSMWNFCREYLNLSEGASQRRIQAMRLRKQVPEVQKALEDGTMSLCNAAKIESFFRVEKKRGRAQTVQQKKETVHQMMGLSQSQCEKKLFQISPSFKSAQNEVLKPIAEDQNVLKVILDFKQVEQLKLLKDRLAHRLPDASYTDLIAYLIEDKLKQIEKKMGTQSKGVSPETSLTTTTKTAGELGSTPTSLEPEQEGQKIPAHVQSSQTEELRPLRKHEPEEFGKPSSQTSTATAIVNDISNTKKVPRPDFVNPDKENTIFVSASHNRWEATFAPVSHNKGESTFVPVKDNKRKAIPAHTKRELWKRADSQCEFTTVEGKRCNSAHQLQIEHRIPVAKGGTNELNNLQLFCFVHNSLRAVEAYSENYMKKWLPRIK